MMASDMASSTLPWLTLSIFVPIVAGLIALLVGRDDRTGLLRVLALVGSVAGFLVTMPLYTGFNPNTADMQFVATASWRSGAHTSELQSLMLLSYAVFSLDKQMPVYNYSI